AALSRVARNGDGEDGEREPRDAPRSQQGARADEATTSSNGVSTASDYLIADEVWQAWHAEGVSWPTFTVSEWADAKRFLPQSSATRGGRWRTDANPCLRGIMNVVHEPNVLKIAVKKAAQVGVSEVLHNI